MNTEPISSFREPTAEQAALRRRIWGQMFGDLIRNIRESLGLTVAEAAERSGLQQSEWMAIEEGCVPHDAERLSAIAGTLELNWHFIVEIAVFCRDAWDC